MSHTLLAKRIRLVCAFFCFMLSALPQWVGAFSVPPLGDIFVEIMRPQTWEPTDLILSVEEERHAVSVLPPEVPLIVVEEEEDDVLEGVEALFQEAYEPPTIFTIPTEMRVRITRYLPYAALFSAVQARIFHVSEAMLGLVRYANEADGAGRSDLLVRYLEEALGLLYRREELRDVGDMNAELLALFAQDVYGVHLAGEHAMPQAIAANLYQLWALVLLHAIRADSPEVRNRAYCELGFVLRLNALSESDTLVERILEALFEGFSQLGYPEFLSLVHAFAHTLDRGVYSEHVQDLAFGCLVGMVFINEAAPLFDEIRTFLLGLLEQERLTVEQAEIVDRLFLHPEKWFRLSLM